MKTAVRRIFNFWKFLSEMLHILQYFDVCEDITWLSILVFEIVVHFCIIRS